MPFPVLRTAGAREPIPKSRASSAKEFKSPRSAFQCSLALTSGDRRGRDENEGRGTSHFPHDPVFQKWSLPPTKAPLCLRTREASDWKKALGKQAASCSAPSPFRGSGGRQAPWNPDHLMLCTYFSLSPLFLFQRHFVPSFYLYTENHVMFVTGIHRKIRLEMQHSS